ncbi:MAG: rRNA pseudouridine synthase [Firmicutes bacterium]|nr:rRNA pseudouridine synthase [Bacillota bacterium]
MQERLQKIIARAGLVSRRQAEQLILAGQVTVNGRVVSQLGAKADPERDHICVGGRRLRLPTQRLCLALHKPAGCVATLHDPQGRRTIAHLLRGVAGRLFPIGRLEYHASGLLLLTNDGELANRILKASDRLPQTYWLKVKGGLAADELAQIARRTGLQLRPLSRRQVGRAASGTHPWYEVSMTGPRRDTLRRLLMRLGHPVEKLKRVKLDGIALASLPPGRYRSLSRPELEALELACALRPGPLPQHEPSPPRAQNG